MALANIQKELIAGGKANMVGDRELYSTATELTRIMGHKNPGRFFNDPTAVNPQTGQLLYPPPAPPAPPPDPKLLALRAKAEADQLAAAHKAQSEQQKMQADAIHQQLKMQAEIELARIKTELDAKMKVLDAHLTAMIEQQKLHHTRARHDMEVTEAALSMTAATESGDAGVRGSKGEGKCDV